MGWGTIRLPKPPRRTDESEVMRTVAQQVRQQERSMAPRSTRTVRATGENTYETISAVAAGDPQEVTFTPPQGGAYKVTAIVSASGLPSDAILTVAASGITTAQRSPASSVVTDGTLWGVSDHAASTEQSDVATASTPLTAIVVWTASGTPDPVDLYLQFIAQAL